jgi:predicted nucleotidyltransferase
MLHPDLKAQLPEIAKLFKENRVKNAYAFGSIVSEKFDDESDIDLLINFEDDIEPLEKGQIWWNLHDRLREMFSREVDLLIEGSLKNPYFIEEINEKKQLIYAA